MGEGDVAYRNIDYGRILFDQIFNFIILMLIVQLLAGIIIDTFGELRTQMHEIEEDSQSNCFVCGQEKK
jgi:hypothetical protein